MKKYIKIILILIVLIIVGVFIFKKYNDSFDIKPQLKYSEFEDYLLDNSDCLVYVTNSKNVSKIKKYFENKDYEIIYMYLNKTEQKEFENKYGITNLPKLIYFKDEALKEYISLDENIDEFLNRNGILK